MDSISSKDEVGVPPPLSLRLPSRPAPQPVMHTSWGAMLRHWPLRTLFIMSNELCERFSYYGMRTVLTFYFINVMKVSDNMSTIYYSAFTILCYAMPLLGSIIADGFIGKFWTIISLSILYASGQILLAISAVQDVQSSVHPVMDLAGLLIIGVGTGGIKPCVAPFGADQFEKHQERMISVYFSMFYFCINLGSMVSSFITPIFRAQPCLGQDTCYPLCFGLPAVLMIVATGVFMAGSYWYDKPPPKGNVFKEAAQVVRVGYFNAIRGGGPKRDHAIEHYLDTHHCDHDERCLKLREEKRKPDACHKRQFVADVRSLGRVLLMFVPLPMFWALFDQQGSVWLRQGVQMDCNVGGALVLPDQLQTMNAVLVLLFIPTFQAFVYPTISRCVTLTPLRKMVAGGLLASLSFVVTGLVQIEVNKTLPELPTSSQAYVSFMNLYNTRCNITVNSLSESNLPPYVLQPNSSMLDNKDDGSQTFHIPLGLYNWSLSYADCLGSETLPKTIAYDFAALAKGDDGGHTNVFFIAIGPRGVVRHEVQPEKPRTGTGDFSLGLTLAFDHAYKGNLALCRADAEGIDPKHPCDPQSPADFYFWETSYNGNTSDIDEVIPQTIASQNTTNLTATAYVFKPVRPGKWQLYFMDNTPKDIDNPPTLSKEQVIVHDAGVGFEINQQGGVFAAVLTGPGYGFTNNHKHVWQVVQNNRVSILWQIPQFVILTMGEILFSVTGLEFAYSQAAPSMKAIVQASFLLTDGIGNVIIIIITAADPFTDMAVMFFAYAGAMFVVISAFALLAIFYFEYSTYTALDDADDEESDEMMDEKGKINASFMDSSALFDDDKSSSLRF